MINEYKVNGDTTIIYCEYKGEMVKTYIDSEDLNLAKSIKGAWKALDKGSKTPYVMYNNKALHRVLIGAKKGEIVDHMDQNGLNNRRQSNLRIVTHSESMRNRSVFTNSTSGYSGVNWSTQYNKWKARIRVDGKDKYLGRFDNLEDAIQALKKGEEKYW